MHSLDESIRAVTGAAGVFACELSHRLAPQFMPCPSPAPLGGALSASQRAQPSFRQRRQSGHKNAPSWRKNAISCRA
jgi:hypothetical protein